MSGISGGVLPIKFDANGNVLSNINAQNIYPVTYGSGLVVTGNMIINQDAVFNAIYIPSGQTLTVNSGVTLIVLSYITGGGTLTINGTLYIAGNVIVDGNLTINGSGLIQINPDYTLTQAGPLTIGVSNIQVVGTWANSSQPITIIAGATVTWVTTGSLTTGSSAGTLTVNGILYYYGAGLSTQTTDAVPTFILKLAGTGIFIASPTQTTGTATTAITLSATAINAGSSDGSATGTGKIPYFSLTSVTGSATGEYGLGIYNTPANTYVIFGLIYIGNTSAYTVSVNVNNNTTDVSGDTVGVYNASGGAGKITLSGTAYV